MEGWPPVTGPECPDIVEGPELGPGALGGLGSDGAGIREDGPDEVWVDVDDGTIFIMVSRCEAETQAEIYLEYHG